MTMVRPNPPTTERRVLFKIRGFPVHTPRGPKRYFTDTTDGYALFPLLVLFGLNAVDELDRSAFGVLGPEIRDSFDLSNQGYLSLVALDAARRSAARGAARVLRRPAAACAHRRHRRGGVGVFGLAHRPRDDGPHARHRPSGAGMGRAVVTPTHNSLLADYYPLEVRAEGLRRSTGSATRSGLILGPLRRRLLAALLRLAASVLRLRDPDARVRRPRAAPQGTRPRPFERAGRRRGAEPSSRPTSHRRRGRSRCASSGRSGRCGASGTRCRSSPRRSSGSRPSRRSTTRRSSTSASRSAASSPRAPNPSVSSASCSASRSRRASC